MPESCLGKPEVGLIPFGKNKATASPINPVETHFRLLLSGGGTKLHFCGKPVDNSWREALLRLD